MNGAINRFDTRVTNYIHSWSENLRPLMNVASLLGEPLVVMSIAALAAFEAWRLDNSRFFWLFVATIIGSIADAILKQFLHRSRPDTVYVTRMRLKSYSFPSGHAFGAILTYGLIAYLAWGHAAAPWNSLAMIILTLLIVLIGVSRVYLGAHFPTDVIGGWLLGGAVLAVLILYL